MLVTKSIGAVMIILLWFSGYAQIDYKGFPQWVWGKEDSTEYYLYTPLDMIPGERYPVVLFLHGCCGEDYKATLRNTVDPPARMWHNFGANTQKTPTYILAPKTSRGWTQHFGNLKAVLDGIVQKGQGDPQRIYITGFSMGAMGTWQFVEEYPDYFAAAIPMGMNFKGKNPEVFKDIPIWAHRGETDWHARHLGTQIEAIRRYNHPEADSSQWLTGINPLLTTYEGLGHVVQWTAASTNDLVGWAYSKVNDGNKYPVVYFENWSFKKEVEEGEVIPIDIMASDPDGSIRNVEVFVNGRLMESLTEAPFSTRITAAPGDTKIEAVAFDDQGKSTAGTAFLKVNIPPQLKTTTLSPAKAGDYYHEQLESKGNGKIVFTMTGESKLPEGLGLTADGAIRGIPVETGKYKIVLKTTDEDGETTEKVLTLKVGPKHQDAVIVKSAQNYAGKQFPVSVVRLGEAPHSGRTDDEVTFSGGIKSYEGLTLIRTEVLDTTDARPFYMEFEADDDVVVYIAYEKLDNLYTSTIPDWLRDYQKEQGQIITQYYYYDVYSREFPKGKIRLPDAEEQKNKVNTNYFVMIRKKGVSP